MLIDLEPMLTGLKDVIIIDKGIKISEDLLNKSSIKKLTNVNFCGKLKRIENLPITLTGNLIGTMILLDDIDLSEVEYDFDIEVDEEIESEYENLIVDNKFNLQDLLWQLIQVEVPSKVHGKNKNNNIHGDGWKLVNEEEINNNNAFRDLDKMLQERSRE